MPIELTRQNCVFATRCKKQMGKLNPVVRRSIEMKLMEIFRGTAKPNIKKLRNYPMGDYRLRIGDYRLLFFYNPETNMCHFTACRHRQDLY